MAKQPKPFEFNLTEAEADGLREPAGQGGHQSLHKRLTSQLENGSTIALNDTELGELIRYMTQYKGGGFQNRLRAAFIRSLKEQLDL